MMHLEVILKRWLIIARSQFSSLRFRLIGLVLVAMVPAIGLIIYSAAEQRKLTTEDVQAEALWLARLVAADQTRFIDETRQLLLTFTHLTVVHPEDAHDCNELFSELLQQYPQYTNFGTTSSSGDVICSAVGLNAPVNLSNREGIRSALVNKTFAIGDYEVDSITGTPGLIYAYPVLNTQNQVQEIIFATLNLDWLNRLVSRSQVPEGASLIMVDQHGTVLVHSPDPQQWIGKTIPDEPLVRTILQQATSKQAITGLDGVRRLYAFTPLQGYSSTQLYVGIGISEAVAYSQANQLLVSHLAGLSVVLILALGAAWIGGDLFILRQIKSLINATKQLASGDLNAHSGLSYGQGELNQLAQSFDQMTDALGRREKERDRAEDEILRKNRNLTLLNTLTATLSSSLKLPEVLETLKLLLKEQVNVPGGIIFFYEEPEDLLLLQTSWGFPASFTDGIMQVNASSLHYEKVVKNQESYLKTDYQQVLTFAHLRSTDLEYPWKSYLCVPLTAKGQVQGVLDLFSKAPEVFSMDQVTLFMALGQQVGIAIHNARLFEQVGDARHRLQILSQQLLEVQENERRHIARELHDEIGQALTAVKVNLQAAIRYKITEVEPYLEDSVNIIERTLQQVRNLSLDLRPSLLDDLGVMAALRWYIDRQAQRAGFEAVFTSDLPERRLPTELETTCFRVVQEALTNIVRHAKAKHVQVELCQKQDELELVIRDDGVGFDLNAVIDRSSGDLSLGLLGMQERVQLIGGWLKIESSNTRGTEIRAYLPLNPQHFYEPRQKGKSD